MHYNCFLIKIVVNAALTNYFDFTILDRFVVIGASRSQFLPQVGTSYMLELARSFKDMQKINGWIPRRTVKFYSWDHDGITNIGFDQHLKVYV